MVIHLASRKLELFIGSLRFYYSTTKQRRSSSIIPSHSDSTIVKGRSHFYQLAVTAPNSWTQIKNVPFSLPSQRVWWSHISPMSHALFLHWMWRKTCGERQSKVKRFFKSERTSSECSLTRPIWFCVYSSPARDKLSSSGVGWSQVRGVFDWTGTRSREFLQNGVLLGDPWNTSSGTPLVWFL